MKFRREINICNLAKLTAFILSVIHVKYVDGRYDKNTRLFYILLWTNRNHNTFMFLQEGNKVFSNNDCLFRNCIIVNTTSDPTPVTQYDALLFNAVTLYATPEMHLPYQRSINQKYVLVSLESAASYPISAKYNNFFNWTWTYKLSSDISFQYIIIKDRDGRIIGPKKDMHWIPYATMKQTNKNIIRKLQNKTKAVAWIVSNCDIMMSKYESFVTDLRDELGKYEHTLDIFGECGNINYLNAEIRKYHVLIKRQYYFYLAFEDSMAEDFVTDQLLIALNHFAVPVVFGGANYTRYITIQLSK